MSQDADLIESLAPDLWTIDNPDQRFFGMRFGSRTTLVRLPDGSLLAHSPVPLTPELRAGIAAIGRVGHIVAPNLFHHLHAVAWAEAFPDARLHAPAGLAKKRKDLPEHRILGEPDPDWGGALQTLPFRGFKSLDETLLFHPASRTLMTADLLENFPESSPHWPTRAYLGLAGIKNKPGMSRVLAMAFDDKPAARASVQKVLDWDFDRITLCHREIVPSGGKDLFAAAYAFLPEAK